MQEFLDGREKRKLGLPDNSGWQMQYDELVVRFLAEAPISTEPRRAWLKQVLERNPLRLTIGADLANIGKLTADCMKIGKKQTPHYAVFSVQAPLKQLSRWATVIGLRMAKLIGDLHSMD